MLRPPPGLLLAYRFFGWRLGPAYRDWVLSDIVRKGWVLRQGSPALAAVLLLGAPLFAAFDGDPARLYALVFVGGGAALFLRTSLQERALRQQGIDASGERLPTADWYDDQQARLQRNLLSTVATVVLSLGGLVLLAARSAP